MASNYSKDAYQIIYKHPEWKETATKYEDNFAANLVKSDYVYEAARTALTRVSNMLMAYYGIRDKKEETGQEKLDLAALADVAGIITGKDTSGYNATLSDRALKSREVLEENLLSNDIGAGQVGKAAGADGLEKNKVKFDSLQLFDTVNDFIDPKLSDEANSDRMARMFNQLTIDKITFGDGNTREMMTMLYNALILKGGRSKEEIAGSRSVKNMLLNITQADVDQMRTVGDLIHEEDNSGTYYGQDQLSNARIDFADLQEMEHYRNKEDLVDTYTLARDLGRARDKRKGRGGSVSRWWAGIKRALNANLVRVFGFQSTKGKSGLGEEHYNELGIFLSDRERAHGINAENKLAWKEGFAYRTPKKPVTAEGMLQTAGPSGTTLRMLGAYKLLGASKAELLYFRLALIGWMASSRDHSLYEILVGSRNAGVTGKEDLSEAARMYQTVDPLELEEIRQLVPNGELPHETVYKKMLTDYWKKYGALLSSSNQKRMGTAGNMALNLYTTSYYKVMNAAEEHGSLAGMIMANVMVGKTKAKTGELYDILRVTNRMAQDSLTERSQVDSPLEEIENIHDYDVIKEDPEAPNTPEQQARFDRQDLHLRSGNAYRGITFRGGKFNASMASGTYTANKLTSTSQKLMVANGFYNRAGGKAEDKAIFCFYLDGKNAVNISTISSIGGEEEVLVPIGTTFRIERYEKAAYLDVQNNKIYTQEEMEADEALKDRYEREEGEWIEKENSLRNQKAGKNALNMHRDFRKWNRCQVVYMREVGGPGAEARQKREAGRQKRLGMREWLLAHRQKWAMQGAQ